MFFLFLFIFHRLSITIVTPVRSFLTVFEVTGISSSCSSFIFSSEASTSATRFSFWPPSIQMQSVVKVTMEVISKWTVLRIFHLTRSCRTKPFWEHIWKPLSSERLQFTRVTQWGLHHYADQSTWSITIPLINHFNQSAASLWLMGQSRRKS